ncbi:MAG: hypothetical protein IV100_18765 [Myxococcales bacterium]|nr:hypothetical protein [Myxococcales bacterium]
MVSLFVSLSSLVVSAQADCDGVTPPEGRCENERRVTWCEGGHQKHFDCPEDTVCAWNDMLPGFDCVLAPCSRDLDGDGTWEDIPPTGLCHVERLVWCASGRVKELSCAESAVCGWNDELGAYDCISGDPAAPGEDVEASADVSEVSDDDAGTSPQPGGDASGSDAFAGPVQYDDVGTATPTAPVATAGCGVAATRASGAAFAVSALTWMLFFGLRVARRSSS